MNKRRIILIFVLAMLLTSLLAVGGAQAASPQTRLPPPSQPVWFLYVRTATLDPGSVWIDKTGFHIRGRVDAGIVKGDVNGSTLVVYNADYKFAGHPESVYPQPDSGLAYGSIEIRSDDLDLVAPLWTGNWEYKFGGGLVTSGSMTASSTVTRQFMYIKSIQQLGSGGLLHQGYIVTIGPSPG
jgi:hypothetical protein